jgi:hypothetical protein
VPGSVQFKAQHKRAALTSGLSLFILAMAQQSIWPAMSPIPHSFSPECMGMPASALAASTARRKKDVSHFAIAR